MADPLSIVTASASLAVTAFKLGQAIATFKGKVSGVDQSVEQLQFNVHGLGCVLDALSKELERPEFTAYTNSLAKPLAENLPKTITNCELTLVAIDARITKLQPTGNRNLVKQTWRAIKLQWKQSEIDESLGYVKMHSMNLQLSLSIVSLHNSMHQQNLTTKEQHARFDSLEQLVQSQTTFAGDQLERFDKLEQMISVLTEHLSTTSTPSLQSSDEYLQQVPVDESTRSLVEGARSFVSSASTAMGRSSTGRTTIPDDSPIFEYIGNTQVTALQDQYEESTTGSEWGNPLDADRRFHLQSWVQRTPTFEGIAEETASHESTPDQSTHTRSSVHSSTETPNSQLSSHIGLTSGTTTQASELFYSSGEDNDGDIDADLLDVIFRTAKELAEAEQWERARLEFLEGFKVADKSNARQFKNIDLMEMKLQYCRCSIAAGLKETAEEMLAGLAGAEPDNAEALKSILQARRLLAFIRLLDGDFNSAENHCRQTLNAQRRARSIGKIHQEYYDTLMLMSLIMLVSGQMARSRHYAELQPDKRKLAAQVLLNAVLQSSECQTIFPAMSSGETSQEIRLNLSSQVELGQGQIDAVISSWSFGPLLKLKPNSGAVEVGSGSDVDSGHIIEVEQAQRTEIAPQRASLNPAFSSTVSSNEENSGSFWTRIHSEASRDLLSSGTETAPSIDQQRSATVEPMHNQFGNLHVRSPEERKLSSSGTPQHPRASLSAAKQLSESPKLSPSHILEEISQGLEFSIYIQKPEGTWALRGQERQVATTTPDGGRDRKVITFVCDERYCSEPTSPQEENLLTKTKTALSIGKAKKPASTFPTCTFIETALKPRWIVKGENCAISVTHLGDLVSKAIVKGKPEWLADLSSVALYSITQENKIAASIGISYMERVMVDGHVKEWRKRYT